MSLECYTAMYVISCQVQRYFNNIVTVRLVLNAVSAIWAI